MAKKNVAKNKGVKLPKQVAGVKIPKEWRKGGEALIARATSAEGQAALAKGLTVAAGLATMAAERTARARAATPRPAAAAEPAAPPRTPVDPAKLGEAVEMVASSVLGRLFGANKA